MSPNGDDRVLAILRSNFDSLNRRFDTLEGRFDRVENKLDEHHQMLGKHEQAIEHVETRLEQISARTHKTNNDIQALTLSSRMLPPIRDVGTREREGERDADRNIPNENKALTPYQLRWLVTAAAAGGGSVWWFVNYMATHGKLSP